MTHARPGSATVMERRYQNNNKKGKLRAARNRLDLKRVNGRSSAAGRNFWALKSFQQKGRKCQKSLMSSLRQNISQGHCTLWSALVEEEYDIEDEQQSIEIITAEYIPTAV